MRNEEEKPALYTFIGFILVGLFLWLINSVDKWIGGTIFFSVIIIFFTWAIIASWGENKKLFKEMWSYFKKVIRAINKIK